MSKCVVFHRFVFVLFRRQTHAHKEKKTTSAAIKKYSVIRFAVLSCRLCRSFLSLSWFFFFLMFTSFHFKRWTQGISFLVVAVSFSFQKTKGKIDFSSVAWNSFFLNFYFSIFIISCQLKTSRMELAYECNEWKKYGKIRFCLNRL